MAAYYGCKVSELLNTNSAEIQSRLVSRYRVDGYFQLLSSQVLAWEESIPLIRSTLQDLVEKRPVATGWGVLLEYPLYRLRSRIDLALIASDMLFVIELKIGESVINAQDRNQVEEYALELRDFHRASHSLPMQPVLCCTELSNTKQVGAYKPAEQIQPVVATSAKGLADVISEKFEAHLPRLTTQIGIASWNNSQYEPVPTIIEAATSIYAGHNVKDISRSEAANLNECSEEVLRLIEEARSKGGKKLIVVTGVPGAGKTLAGLNVAHGGTEERETKGEVVYLSGNTPLVLVIREALAQDEYARAKETGHKRRLSDIRHDLKTRIQHIIDFLKEYCNNDLNSPPHEHAIVFDEAQRAWDHKQGLKKFERDNSEPDLLLRIMDRHKDWAALVCLVGAGQEINTGEAGLAQWGEALSSRKDWEVVAPHNALYGGSDTAGTAMFPDSLPSGLRCSENEHLRLTVPIRSFRSERVSQWVEAVLTGNPDEARRIALDIGQYPITLTRSLDECRNWLHQRTRGLRRCGLLASTSAVRLLAEGLGASLTVQDKEKICHWYLKPSNDYRCSNYLEVTANEYTCQGLELDYAGICWGGDFVRTDNSNGWSFRQLSSTSWNKVHKEERRRFILNKYRVFLTRAREGMVLFVPRGHPIDRTRRPQSYDGLAEYLEACGAETLKNKF